MIRIRPFLGALLLLCSAWGASGQARTAGGTTPSSAPAWPIFSPSPPEGACQAAILIAERAEALPPQLLAAIGRVESGRRDPATGALSSWPWTIDAEGQGQFFATKVAAISAVRSLQARGVRSIDVGCMQINLMHHPDAFASLEDAFDPVENAAYGARLLRQLYEQSGNWRQAAALYHSATPEIGADYARRVAEAWAGAPAQEAPLALPAAPGLRPVGSPGAVRLFLPARGSPGREVSAPAGPGSLVPAGRGLAAYRMAPIAVVTGVARRAMD